MKGLAVLRSRAFRWGVPGLLLLVAFGLAVLFRPWQAFAPDNGFGLREYRDSGLLLAAVLGLPLLGLLLFLWPAWWPTFTRRVTAAPPAGPRPAWIWLAPLLAAVVLCSQAVPRLGFSLWEDEDVAVRKFIVGAYEQKKDGVFRVDPASWDETLFGFWRPTNHVPQSALSKVSHGLWASLNPEAGFAFNETALRLPALLCGIGALFALTALLLESGFPVAAAAAPFFLALHPWFIRFSSEARGYSLSFLMLLLALWAALWFLRRPGVSPALLFSITSAVCVWAYAGMFAPMAVVWIALFGWLVLRHPPEWSAALVRLLVVAAVVAVAFLPLAAPLAPQFIEYTRSESQTGEMGWNWMTHAASYAFVGAPRQVGPADDPDLPQFAAAGARYGALATLGFWVFVLLGGAGVVLLARRRPELLLCMVALFLGAALIYWNSARSDFRLHEWYFYYLSLPMLLLPLLGAEGLARLLPQPFRRRAGMAACLLLFGAYLFGTEPVRTATLSRPHMPIREGYLLARGTLDPNAPGQDRIVTLACEPTPRLYDPRVETVSTRAELEEAIAGLPPEGRLFVLVRQRARNDNEYAEVIGALDAPGAFEVTAELKACFPFEDRWVYELRSLTKAPR